jgi:hypothetical protein
MNLYWITVRGQDGKISDQEIEATSMHLAGQDHDEQSEVLKAECIDPLNGEVLYEFYNEVGL